MRLGDRLIHHVPLPPPQTNQSSNSAPWRREASGRNEGSGGEERQTHGDRGGLQEEASHGCDCVTPALPSQHSPPPVTNLPKPFPL